MGVLAAHDQAGPGRPSGQVDQVGQLDDLGAVTAFPAGLDGWLPVVFGDEEQGVADAVVDVVAERVLDVAIAAFLAEPVRRPGGVGAGQQPFPDMFGVVAAVVADLPVGGELRDGGGEHDDVVGGGVGAGVARTQLAGEDFAGLGDHRQQRVMSVGPLVGRGGVLLVGAGADDRRVEVDDRLVAGRSRTGGPRRLACVGAGASETAQLVRAQLVERAPRRRVRRDRPEQGGLIAQHRQIRHARRAVSQRDDHLCQRPPRIMAPARSTTRRRAQPGSQTEPVSDLAQPDQPGMKTSPSPSPVTVRGRTSLVFSPIRKPSDPRNERMCRNTHSPR